MFEYHVLVWLCIKPGIQEPGTDCGERGEGGNVIFRGMSPNIPGNVAKHSGNVAKHSRKYRQVFRGMSPPNIPGDVVKHSGECHQTFRGMSQNIPGK